MKYKQENIRPAVLQINAIDHPLRCDILNGMEVGKSYTVTEIYIKHRIGQSHASQHLAILRRANLVTTKRQGKNVYYSKNDKHLAMVLHLAQQLKEVRTNIDHLAISN